MTSISPNPLDTHHFAIIDRAAIVEEMLPHGLNLIPLVPDQLTQSAEIMPALLPLADLSPSARMTLHENLEASATGKAPSLLACLLAVDDPIEIPPLHQHLTHHLIVNSPQGQALLRFYDPRVFRHLLWILNKTQCHQLFGPINRWSLCRYQGIPSVTRPTHPAPLVANPSPDWNITEFQREQLDRVGLINEMIKWLSQYHPAIPARYDNALEPIARRIDTAMACATQRYQLEQDNDLMAFATHSLLYGDDFHELPQVQEWIQGVIRQQVPYINAVSHIENALAQSSLALKTTSSQPNHS